MALYEYNLYLAREDRPGSSLTEALVTSGLLEADADGTDADRFRLLPDVSGFCYEGRVGTESGSIQITTILLEADEIERQLVAGGARLIAWLWQVVEAADVAVAMIAGGADAAYYRAAGIDDDVVLDQLTELINTGVVRYVHPLMYFASRVGSGATCSRLVANSWFYTSVRDTGCLALLLKGAVGAGPIELLDPGVNYPEIASGLISAD